MLWGRASQLTTSASTRAATVEADAEADAGAHHTGVVGAHECVWCLFRPPSLFMFVAVFGFFAHYPPRTDAICDPRT